MIMPKKKKNQMHTNNKVYVVPHYIKKKKATTNKTTILEFISIIVLNLIFLGIDKTICFFIYLLLINATKSMNSIRRPNVPYISFT